MSSVDTFLEVVNVLSDIFLVFVLIDIIGLFLLMFLEKYDPRTFLSWLILLIFLPPVGFILYMYMGYALYKRSQFKPKNITDTQLMRNNEFHRSAMEEDMANRPEHADALGLAQVLRNAGGWSYSKNNDVRLYTEGKPMMDDMFDAFRGAEKSILIEYYIIRNDRRGNEMMGILTQKVREGLEVRLLTDGFGIGKGPKKAIKRFIAAGGHYGAFHAGASFFLSPKKNNRNHRKIAIVDGAVAFCGGFNVGDEYEGEGPLGHWRDASVRVAGPGVLPMLVRFSADWQYVVPKDLLKPVQDYLDESIFENGGDVRMQLVSGGPDTMPANPTQIQYLTMASRAKRLLYITTPYLIPDDSTSTALKNAARSGVDVRILIPDKPDHIFMYWNNQTFAYDLMKAGVRVYRYNDGFIHEKVFIMDDECLSVGSANLDNRSLALNFETNVMLYSKELRDQACDQFLSDLERSTEYTCEDYESSGLEARLRMSVSRMFKLLS